MTRSSFPSPIRLLPIRGWTSRIGWGAWLLLFGIASCDSGPTAPELASVRVTADGNQVRRGATTRYEAQAFDRKGAPIPGQVFQWSSSDPTIASVDPSGLVTGVQEGNAVITASVGGISGIRSIQVLPQPVASVEISPRDFELARGTERTLTVLLKDDRGAVLEGRSVTFSSSSPQIATISSTGIVRGISAGTATLTAKSEEVESETQVRVFGGMEPVIQGITPEAFIEGEEALLTGERFSATPSLNEVRIGGERAVVLEASTTQLRIRVPSGSCFPPGLQEVTLSVAGDVSDPVLHPVRVEEAEPLLPGTLRRLPADTGLCLRLPPSASGERYLIGLQSFTGQSAVRTPALLQGRVSQGVATGQRSATQSPLGTSFSAFLEDHRARGDHAPTLPLRWREHTGAEAQIRTDDSRLRPPLSQSPLRSLREPGAAGFEPLPSPLGVVAVPSTVQEGDTLSVKVPDVSSSNFCRIGIPVQAVVRKVGPTSVWLEDVANPAGGFSATDYDRLSTLFDREILPEITDYFGTPTDLDQNGRVVILISREVNRTTRALAFVVSTDFFPGECPGSNGGEFYYARAPDPSGVVSGPGGQARAYALGDALADAPTLLAHETTHIIQFGRRIFSSQSSGYATAWELEGQATLAEEVVGYRFLSLGPRQNLGFEVAFNQPARGPERWFQSGLVDLAVYHGFRSSVERSPGAPEGCGWLGRDVAGDCQVISDGKLEPYGRLLYGVPWSLLRWISDHYGSRFPGGERELHRRLVVDSEQGFRTLEKVVGEPIASLLAPWAASLYLDGRLPSGFGDPQLRFPSWDLRAIEARLVSSASLDPRRSAFEPFEFPLTVAAGSSSFLLLEGGARSGYSIRARTPEGALLPEHMQLWVVRLP